MHTQTVTKTVVLPLRTNQRKLDRVQSVIDEWQSIAKTVADYHASFPPHQWGNTTNNSSFYRIVQRERPDRDIHSQGALAAVHKVGTAFQSWRSNGMVSDRPSFGSGDYCRFTGQGFTIAENGDGYGLKVNLEPYDAEWFKITDGAYQREYLDGVVNGDLNAGALELHRDGKSLSANLAVSEDIDVLEFADVATTIGVDLGERIMYAAAAVNGSVQNVIMERGAEFRHHRERIKAKKQSMQAESRLRDAARQEYYRYTDHVTHTASKAIVDFARGQHDPGIRLEDLSHYREAAADPIHDWPFADLQAKIVYKAHDAGIPVTKVTPEQTSITCRKCGMMDARNRHHDRFECVSCGYEVHADVNAAINIAKN